MISLNQRLSERYRLGGLCGAVFFLSLALYAYTAQRGVGWQDSGEFQYRVLAADYFWISGIARAHPLYIFAARSFSFLFPAACRFYAINLFSGVGMSVALVFLTLILWSLTRNRWAVIVAVATLGLAQMAWWMSTIAEVYTWSAAFLMAEMFCLLKIIENNRRMTGGALDSNEKSSQDVSLGWWIALATINGLHASLHNFAFLNLPVYSVLFMTQHLGKKVGLVLGRIVICLISWLVGATLLVGLFVLEWRTTGSVIDTVKSMLFGREFEQVVLGTRVINWHLAAMNFALASVSLLNPCWVFVVFGWKAVKSIKTWGWCLLGLTMTHFLFWARYFVADQATFMLPVLSLLAIWMGYGFATRMLSTSVRVTFVLVAITCSVAGPVLVSDFLEARQGGVVRSRTLPFRDETRYWLLPWKHNEKSAEYFVKGVRGILREHDVLIADNTAAGPVIAMREAGELSRQIRVIGYVTGETDEEQVHMAATCDRVFVVSPVSGYAPAKLLDGQFHFEQEGVLYRVIDKRRVPLEKNDE